MTEQPPPPPPPPTPGPIGGPPPPAGVPRPAELMDRFLARLIDGIGFAVIYFVLLLVFTAILVSGFQSRFETFLLTTFVTVIFTAAYIAYYAFFESNQGATVGKQLMKLKVVGPDGAANPTMEQAVRRNLFQAIGLIGILPFVGFFLGPLASLVAVIMIAVGINGDTVNRQGWHDKFAGGTRVLKIG